jgi:hypothetical protein
MLCLPSHVARSPDRQIARDKARPVLRQQSWSVPASIQPRRCQRHHNRLGDVCRVHRRAELPGDDEPEEIVEDRR